jgi:hypothetical protein
VCPGSKEGSAAYIHSMTSASKCGHFIRSWPTLETHIIRPATRVAGELVRGFPPLWVMASAPAMGVSIGVPAHHPSLYRYTYAS